MSIKIGINGFGRIGRVVFRAAMNHPDVEVVAINDLTDAATMAHLLKYDSVHAKLDMDIKAKDGAIEVNGKSIAYTAVKDPEKLAWKDCGVDIACECTGLFRNRDSAAKHLTAGARKVAPLRSALNGKLPHVLVTDMGTAESLLADGD